MFLPSDAENDTQMSHVEGLQHLHVLSIEDPGLGAIKKDCQDNSLINLDLRGNCHTVILPEPVIQSAKTGAGFSYTGGNLMIQH